MTFLTIICWIMGIAAAGVVVLWFFGGILSASNEEKANAYLAEKYDRERGR